MAAGLALGHPGAASASEVTAASALDATSLPPEPTRRTIEIDDRIVTVEMLIIRTLPGIPFEGQEVRPTVTATVRLKIQDGAPLPLGMQATRVRFEKFFGRNRVFHADLEQVAVIATEFELDVREFRADISRSAKGAQRLRALIRIEIPTAIPEDKPEVIRVPMGTVPVGLIALP